MEKKNIEKDLATRVCESVCAKCKNNLICWEKNYNEISNAFNIVEKNLKETGKRNNFV